MHSGLNVKAKNFVKGTNPKADSYSGFYDDNGDSTGLYEYLTRENVVVVSICGLTTEYCVKFTALDALASVFSTIVLKDLCRAVDIEPCDGYKALVELEKCGVQII